MEIYKGVLDTKQMSLQAKLAYQSWMAQRDRCNNSNNPRYRHYGGKGLKVEYNSREFVGWWLEKNKHFEGKTPTIGRINHDAGYYFSNVMLQDKSDNTKEQHERLWYIYCKPVISYEADTLKILKQFHSCIEASKYYGINDATISASCVHKSKRSKHNIIFRFADYPLWKLKKETPSRTAAKAVTCYMKKTMEPIISFLSAIDAGEYFNISTEAIYKCCQRESIKSKHEYLFRYAKGGI